MAIGFLITGILIIYLVATGKFAQMMEVLFGQTRTLTEHHS